MDHLHTLPRDPQSYGLIHFDAHTSNLFVDDHTDPPIITLFDFDDCAYSWFANDIAIVLFYAISTAKNPPEATQNFMIPFLRGYRRENRLDPAWLAEIPHFLKLREVDLYAMIHRSLGPGPYDDLWVAHFMDGRKQRLAAGLPYVAFDFTTLDADL
jgi:Ser/Thr protein kinase RdoA (MazF antagonist)